MPWESLASTFLAGKKRKEEIEAENQSEYDQWVSSIYSEIRVFVKRVNGLDLEEASDRDELYELINQFADRFSDLRERSESAGAPVDALIKMDEMIDRMKDSSSPIAVGMASWSRDPMKKARHEKRREKDRAKRVKRVRDERNEIAEKIEDFTAELEE